MILWQVTWTIVILFVPLIILLIWTVLPIRSAEEHQKKRWDKKWKKNFPELYEEENK